MRRLIILKEVIEIVKKEFKELLSNKEFQFYYLILIVVAGVIIPISTNNNNLENWLVTGFVFQVMAAIIPSNLTADSFAGEKERKTLETLLTLPITTTTIFLGKAFFVELISFLILFFSFLLNIVTINVINFLNLGEFSLIIYSGLGIYTILVNGIAISSFIAFLGILISLWVKSVRGANLLSYFVGVPIIIPVVIKLMNVNITWNFIIIFSVIIFILDIIIALIVKHFFKIPIIMKRI